MNTKRIVEAWYPSSTHEDFKPKSIVCCKMNEEGTLHLSILADEENSDYQDLLKWVAEGNTIKDSPS